MKKLIERIYNHVRFNLKYYKRYEYKVQPGDTIQTLADKFDVPKWSIIYLNEKNPNCGSLVFPYKTMWIPINKPK